MEFSACKLAYISCKIDLRVKLADATRFVDFGKEVQGWGMKLRIDEKGYSSLGGEAVEFSIEGLDEKKLVD